MSAPLAGALAAGRDALAAAGVGEPELDARVLLGRATGLDAVGLIARSREPLAPEAALRYAGLIARRGAREPLAYVTGEREFWSLPLRVDARVLVPRPETELLVEEALRVLPAAGCAADVGTGSGAVALALAAERPGLGLWATDLSAAALALARANAEALGLAGRIAFLEGDLLEPLAAPTGRLDLIVSNPPYVPAAEIETLAPEVRDHEPRLALDGGPDGLAVVRRLLAQAPRYLRPGGRLLLEIGAGQACAVRDLAAAGPWEPAGTRRDLAGIERVVSLRRREG